MADPFTAIQVAGAAIQFAEVIILVGKRIKQFSDNNIELPEDIKDVAITLDTIQVSLTRLSNALKDEENLQEDFSSLYRSVKRLEEHCVQLEKKLATYLPKENAPVINRVKTSIRSISVDDAIERLKNNINKEVSSLHFAVSTLHFSRSRNWKNTTAPSINNYLAQRRFNSVPHRHVPYFVNRDDVIGDIKSKFLDIGLQTMRSKVVVLSGMGGQGKTQLALEYASRSADEYQGVFWVDAGNKALVIKGFEQISERIKFVDQPFLDSDARVSFAKSALSEWTSKWLIIFDNYYYEPIPADSDSQNLLLFDIREFFPNSRSGHILITSTSPHVKEIGSPVEIKGMSLEQASQLFYLKSGIQRNEIADGYVYKIVKRLGFLPLSINQVSVYLRRNRHLISLENLLSHYEENMEKVLKSAPEFVEWFERDDGSLMKKTAWNMSYSLLDS
ncbi:hypothetical protein ABW19_dt0204635 [Dactylella cylindrospora]|nr:hypothetical protein ABW19_dt0204635 [Dactylella cylindrospora]